MKITLDVPDTTVCAYFCYVTHNSQGEFMNCASLGTDKFHDGNEIKIPVEKEEGEDECLNT